MLNKLADYLGNLAAKYVERQLHKVDEISNDQRLTAEYLNEVRGV